MDFAARRDMDGTNCTGMTRGLLNAMATLGQKSHIRSAAPKAPPRLLLIGPPLPLPTAPPRLRVISPALAPAPRRAAVGITKTVRGRVVSGAMRARKIVLDLKVKVAVDFGCRTTIALPQIALHVGVIALMTLTAAALLVCAILETNDRQCLEKEEHEGA